MGDVPRSLKKYERDDFRFIGTVHNLDSVLRRATFALAPIEGKTGIRIKILNYLAAGLPIIATDDAISGIGNKDLFFIENNISKYTDLILKLSEDEKYLVQKAKKERHFIESSYNWNIIARKTADIYRKILLSQNPPRDRAEIDISVIKNKEPVWLQEAKRKRRFKQIPSKELMRSFSYAIVKNGKIEFFDMRQIIALEGMPCAGKSTSLNFFTKERGNYSRVALPQLELNIGNKAMGAGDIETSIRFLKAEKMKTDLINKLSKGHKEILLDRSFISTFAYCYARAKMEKNMDQYLRLKNELSKMRRFITLPTKIIYFGTSISESLKRRAFFGDVNSNYWSNPIFLKYFREFYEERLGEIIDLKPEKIVTTDLDISHMLREVKKLL